MMQRLLETNLEQTVGYGGDDYTAQAKTLVRKACGDETLDVHFLVGGTQTNSTVIDALLAHHEGVLAAETAHINVHESGAIESCGHKVLTLPSHAGKVDADITPIGYVPKAEDICIEGLDGITLDTVKDLLTVDTEAWLEDVENIKAFYAQVGDHVPQAMYDELAALEARLKAAK